MLSLFQLLMVAIAKVKLASSSGLNWSAARPYTSSGTLVSATRVTTSVHSRAALSRSEYNGTLSPGVKQVEALFRLTEGARILRVHVNAVCAAIDLRCAELYQFEEGRSRPQEST